MLSGTGATCDVSVGYEGSPTIKQPSSHDIPTIIVIVQLGPRLEVQMKSRKTAKYLKSSSEQRIDQNSISPHPLKFTMVMVTINWDSNSVKPARN